MLEMKLENFIFLHYIKRNESNSLQNEIIILNKNLQRLISLTVIN